MCCVRGVTRDGDVQREPGSGSHVARTRAVCLTSVIEGKRVGGSRDVLKAPLHLYGTHRSSVAPIASTNPNAPIASPRRDDRAADRSLTPTMRRANAARYVTATTSEIARLGSDLIVCTHLLPSRATSQRDLAGACVNDLAFVGDARLADDLVLEVQRQRAILDEQLKERGVIAR